MTRAEAKRRARTRRIVLTGATVVALGLAGTGAWALSRPSEASTLVTGTVTTGEVTQTLSGTGTVAAVGDVSASFPASAEVTSVLRTPSGSPRLVALRAR